MKEYPILFSGEEVRAYLDGRKTQARRVIRPQPVDVGGTGLYIQCPYGQPGDRLWVRETWAVSSGFDSYPPRILTSAASGPQIAYEAGGGFEFHPGERGRWRRSIHMPRWASRLTPDVTAVRVEQVQEITPEDICGEGVWNPAHSVDEDCSQVHEAWVDVWDKINAKRGYGWDANPWIWVIEFPRRIA